MAVKYSHWRSNPSAAQRDIKETEDDRKYSLLYQLTHITRDRGSLRHDDRLDAVAGAVGYWVESMARDEKKAEKAHRESLLDQELKRFKQHVFGKPKAGKGWIRRLG